MGIRKNSSGSKAGVFSCALVLLLSCAAGLPLLAYEGSLSAKVSVSGLQGPAGMAVHPETGDIYVAEKKGGRVSVIRGGSASPVISTGWSLDPNIPFWAVSRELSKEALVKPTLNNPGSVAISTNGTLYVCESVPSGRLLEFAPDAQGNYTKGKIIPIPWIDRPFSWTDVKVTRDGRLFLVGGVAEADVLHFGTVLMRDEKGDWWVVDYGPFINFSSVYLSRNEDIVIVCERDSGGVVWWDAVRHLPIGTLEESGKNISADAVSLLVDGAFVVGQNVEGGGARAIRVDPLTGEQKDMISGLDRIGGLLLSSANSSLYISDEAKGVILEASVPAPSEGAEYLLQRSLDGYQMGEGFTPRQAPGFLKNFFSQVGSAQTGATGEEEGLDAITDRLTMSFSLREFAAKIPLIAGKIEARALEEAASAVNEDPLTLIEFVIFFPGKTIASGDMATPSLAYFAAQRKSGRIERTRELFTGLNIRHRKAGGSWEEGGDTARIMVPVSSVGIEKSATGMDLNLAFLGLGIYSDYYLRLTSGQENTGEIVVEAQDGTREIYRAVFTEMAKVGTGADVGAEIKNLVVAGFDPMQQDSGMGWLNIGRSPVNVAVATSMSELHEFAGMDSKITAMIQKKDREIISTRPEDVVEGASPDAVPQTDAGGETPAQPDAPEETLAPSVLQPVTEEAQP